VCAGDADAGAGPGESLQVEDEHLTQAQLDELPNCPYSLKELENIGVTLRCAVSKHFACMSDITSQSAHLKPSQRYRLSTTSLVELHS